MEDLTLHWTPRTFGGLKAWLFEDPKLIELEPLEMMTWYPPGLEIGGSLICSGAQLQEGTAISSMRIED